MTATWLEKAQRNKVTDLEQSVMIDRWGELFHEDNWCIYGNQEENCTLEEAAEDAKPCSQCFPILHTFCETERKLEMKQNLGMAKV